MPQRAAKHNKARFTSIDEKLPRLEVKKSIFTRIMESACRSKHRKHAVCNIASDPRKATTRHQIGRLAFRCYWQNCIPACGNELLALLFSALRPKTQKKIGLNAFCGQERFFVCSSEQQKKKNGKRVGFTWYHMVVVFGHFVTILPTVSCITTRVYGSLTMYLKPTAKPKESTWFCYCCVCLSAAPSASDLP